MQHPWEPVGGGRFVLLIRHGRTEWNAQGRFLGRTDVDLDELGISQASRLASIGRAVGRVRSSPLIRARRTAEALGKAVEVSHDLVELDQGSLEGMGWREAVERYPAFFRQFAEDPERAVVPGGESLGTLRQRAVLALNSSIPEPGEVLALVTHQMVISSLRCTVAGRPLSEWRSYSVGNATVTALRWTAGDWEEVTGDWSPGGPVSSDV